MSDERDVGERFVLAAVEAWWRCRQAAQSGGLMAPAC